jgi:adenylate kinase
MKKLTKKNLVFLGAPGAGKGTIAGLMLKNYELAHISTGDILRSEVAKGTELGKEAAILMKAGKLVSDEIVAGMVKSRIAEKDCEAGFILDGFPRTIKQAELLNEALAANGKSLDQVVYFKVDDELILQRLTARLCCRGCDAIYNRIFMPPKDEKVCDKCGAELYQRADDSLETAKNRLEVFYQQTSPLIDFYTKSGLLLEITETDMDKIMAAVAENLE